MKSWVEKKDIKELRVSKVKTKQFFIAFLKVLIVIIGVSMVIATIAFAQPRLYWGVPISCNSNSMYPAINCTNRLGLEDYRGQELKIGNIVVYSPSITVRYKARQLGFWISTQWIVHRIIGINGTSLTLKGDYNSFIDNDYLGDIKSRQVSYIVREVR